MNNLTDKLSARRREVARLLLARHTQQDIAAQLGISQSTVSSDISTIRASWVAEAHTDIEELVAEECRVLDADEAALRVRFHEALAKDPRLAVRIYECLVRINDRRLRWHAFVPPVKADPFAAFNAALDELGLGPEPTAAD
ncbi:MAG: LuxR C-terminal-related transcriptional regulator [Chloroflexia bacterium]